MGAMKQWEIEKLGVEEALYAALVALVGAVEPLKGSGAYLSWRTSSGIEGHWREEQGQLWLGRIIRDLHDGGRMQEQLCLELDAVSEGEEYTRIASPTVYRQRDAEGAMTILDADTPQIYAAAHALLIKLTVELQGLLPHLGEEETDEN